jgi:hypothetical protein
LRISAIHQRDVSKEVAHLDAEVEVEAASAGSVNVSVQYSDNGKLGDAIAGQVMRIHAGAT